MFFQFRPGNRGRVVKHAAVQNGNHIVVAQGNERRGFVCCLRDGDERKGKKDETENEFAGSRRCFGNHCKNYHATSEFEQKVFSDVVVLYEYSRHRTKGAGTKNENGELGKEGMKSASCRMEPLFFHHFVVKLRYFFRFPVARHQTHQRSVFIKRRFSETVPEISRRSR